MKPSRNNRESCKNYHKKHREKLIADMKQYKIDHKKEIQSYNKKYREENSEKIKHQTKLYRELHPEKVKIWKRRYKEKYRIFESLRERIRGLLRNQNVKKRYKTLELVGCDLKTLKNHLENKFVDGMSWENYGRYGWHIDHIIPCSSFDMRDVENQKKCCHYTNLQPLWWRDNIKKGNRII